MVLKLLYLSFPLNYVKTQLCGGYVISLPRKMVNVHTPYPFGRRHHNIRLSNSCYISHFFCITSKCTLFVYLGRGHVISLPVKVEATKK